MDTHTHTHRGKHHGMAGLQRPLLQSGSQWAGVAHQRPRLVPASSPWHTVLLLAGTERNVAGWKRQEQPATWVRAVRPSSWQAQVLYCKLLCVCVCVCVCVWLGKSFRERSPSRIKVLCLSFLPALLALSSPSRPFLPPQSSNHVFPCLFPLSHPVTGLFAHLWKSEGGKRRKGGQTQKEVFQLLLRP